MSYKHISTSERGCIEALHNLGYSCRNIASEVGKHHSSIARELKRNDKLNYKAEKAQQAYHERRVKSKPYGKYIIEIAQLIEEKILATWSPEQIANTVTLGKVSFKTIYN